VEGDRPDGAAAGGDHSGIGVAEADSPGGAVAAKDLSGSAPRQAIPQRRRRGRHWVPGGVDRVAGRGADGVTGPDSGSLGTRGLLPRARS